MIIEGIRSITVSIR